MIDFSKITTYPISARSNKFTISQCIPTNHSINSNDSNLQSIAEAMLKSRINNRPILWMFGGAVVKEGCSLLIIDLMKKGYISNIAVNGAVSIHDFEIALIGATSENVEHGLENGTFGMAEETGNLMNQAIREGASQGLGYGESIGKAIADNSLPYRDYSILYQAYKMGAPVTCHIAIGGDIIHQHPKCDGAALGATSFTDFKVFTERVSSLKEGVVLNIGSAVLMPEVFLKALTIARNLGYDARNFTTGNIDFIDQYRPRTRIIEWPKVLGCRGVDVRGAHRSTIPTIHRLIMNNEKNS